MLQIWRRAGPLTNNRQQMGKKTVECRPRENKTTSAQIEGQDCEINGTRRMNVPLNQYKLLGEKHRLKAGVL